MLAAAGGEQQEQHEQQKLQCSEQITTQAKIDYDFVMREIVDRIACGGALLGDIVRAAVATQAKIDYDEVVRGVVAEISDGGALGGLIGAGAGMAIGIALAAPTGGMSLLAAQAQGAMMGAAAGGGLGSMAGGFL